MKNISQTVYPEPETPFSMPHKRKPDSPEQRMRRKIRCASPVPPIPRPFDFGFTARRPLVPLSAVAMFLDREPRQICELIDDGKLRWAFDIRSSRARKREIRILRQSLFEFTGLYARPTPERDAQKEFQSIVNLILPEGELLTPVNVVNRENYSCGPSPVHLLLRLPLHEMRKLKFPPDRLLGATQLAKCFSCACQHVIRLLGEKTLPSLDLPRAAKASPMVSRTGVIAFLEQRRVS